MKIIKKKTYFVEKTLFERFIFEICSYDLLIGLRKQWVEYFFLLFKKKKNDELEIILVVMVEKNNKSNGLGEGNELE